MACHVKYPLFLLWSCAATLLIAYSAEAEQSPGPGSGKNSLPYYPQPYDFPNEQLYQAYLVIQRFKKTITCDPRKITSTWAGHDICGKASYLGFSCSSPSVPSKNLTITSINFHGFGVCAPKLQGFIDQLPDLAIFQATSNRFGGDIPRLADNPADQTYQPLGRLCTYADIELLIKTKASILCNFGYGIQKEEVVSRPGWTNGKVLILNNNRLSGVLPADIGFSALSFLALANNKLTGQIPPSIGHLQDSLLELVLLNNQLSGCLPHELGMLHKAAVIDAGMNQLSGPIPASFSCLRSVEQLNLAGNRLYGEVPDALCKLAAGPPAGRLANLTLFGNYFTSVGPACAALIKDGLLDVDNNCILGLASQRRPADCAAFQRQPKACPAAASAQLTCPTTAAKDSASAPPPGERKGRDYSSYVTYATLHE
ncbi:uncharacterized protein At4g06744-like [Miscanthus floridulus]|uniref:uncharacterized protein At4g06744-like n=1 Tax=Miscanthus floridulus TaxID=154761 RepID=UPI003458E37E